jgi:iron complex transport system permease protein
MFVQIRLTRVVAAMLVGSSLSLSGCTYQAIFKNALASPDLLGVSAGAAFGAALAVVMGLDIAFIPLMAFACGIVAVAITFATASLTSRRGNITLALVLIGMVVAAMFSAGLQLVQLKAAANASLMLQQIRFWLLGSMGMITYQQLGVLLPLFVLGAIPLVMMRWRLNAMSMGDEEARSMGVNTGAVRFISILCSTCSRRAPSLIAASSVGWGSSCRTSPVSSLVPTIASCRRPPSSPGPCSFCWWMTCRAPCSPLNCRWAWSLP